MRQTLTISRGSFAIFIERPMSIWIVGDHARDPSGRTAAAPVPVQGGVTRSPSLPPEVDLLVLGAGAGGMTAALVAAVHGLDVLLAEKTAVVGGTTAISAGSVWVPGTHHSPPRRRRRATRAATCKPRSATACALRRPTPSWPRARRWCASWSSTRPSGCAPIPTIPTTWQTSRAPPSRAGCWSPCPSMPGCSAAISQGCGRPCRSSPCSAA